MKKIIKKILILVLLILPLSALADIWGRTGGELLSGGIPCTGIDWEWKDYKTKVGINLSTAEWEEEYDEYPPPYNSSKGRIYLIGMRIVYPCFFFQKTTQKSEPAELAEPWWKIFPSWALPYFSGETNFHITKTTWMKEGIWEKSVYTGIKIFLSSFFAFFGEIGLQDLSENLLEKGEGGYTYNIGTELNLTELLNLLRKEERR